MRQRPRRSIRQLSSVVLLAMLAVLTLPATALAEDSDDPRRSQMWWFDVIGVEDAWDVALGEGIVVAVLDTGVDATHPDLVDRIADTGAQSDGTDFIDRDGDPSDPNGHGTIVAGLAVATANNDEGIAGVAPRATLMPVRVLDEEGRGQSSTVDAGIRWAVDNGADVVNLSLEVEEQEDGGGPSALLVAPNDAIEYAWERGVIVIAASGNSGAGAAGYRVGSPVVLVGATDKDDELAVFSDHDRDDAVMAPGVEMVSTWCDPTPTGCNPDARYGQGDGTSFAAPIVAGVAALLRSSGLDHQQTVDVLRRSARDVGDEGPDSTFGVGIVDAAAAMAMAQDVLAAGTAPTPADSEPSTAGGSELAADPDATEAPGGGTGPDGGDTSPDASADGDGGSAAGEDRDPQDAEEASDQAVASPADDPGGTSDDRNALMLVAIVLLLAAAAATFREAAATRGGPTGRR